MSLALQPYAVHGESERALSTRRFTAPQVEDRSPFDRDRDRIVQSRAFRRLAGKTQVFTSRISDHFRSRLTHTIEVAQVARHVAKELGLNADLVEALALVHDIGHPPFGHAGERALDQCLQRYGLRFDHNVHALRIVERFEQRYAGHRGLNLTFGVREGIIKHSRDYVAERHPELSEYLLSEKPPLEAQLIDLADEIAYLTADLDDGVESGLLTISHVRENVEVLGRAYKSVQATHPGIEERYIFHDALQAMQKVLVNDLIQTTRSTAGAAGVQTLEDVRSHPVRLAVLSGEGEHERLQEKQYLYDVLYTCDALQREHNKAEEVVSELFEFWANDPAELPEAYYAEVRSEGVPRVVADYIAGMTDNYILLQYADMRRRVRSGVVRI